MILINILIAVYSLLYAGHKLSTGLKERCAMSFFVGVVFAFVGMYFMAAMVGDVCG